MFTAGPDGAGLPTGVGEAGICAGEDATGWPVGAGAARLGVECGHSRKAPSPARASTMTAKATLRCVDVRSIGQRVTSGAGSGAARTVLAGWARQRGQLGPSGPLGLARRPAPTGGRGP